MRKKTLAALSLITLAAACSSDRPGFTDVDADKNGMISAEEAMAVQGLDFTKADANQDGALDDSEWGAATGQ